MPSILAIDDDTSALSSLATILESADYQVQQVPSIDRARQILDEAEPDLVVLEVAADDGAGWNLLRDLVRFQGPPTIVVTRRGREEEIVEAFSIGAADVLPKPFRANELLARVRARLGPPPPPVLQPTSMTPGRVVRRAEAQTVFMPHADEQALMEPPTPVVEIEPDVARLPLGARLHAVRQQRKLTLVQVNLETKLAIWYLQAMEEEKFSLLPRGPAALSMVRTYAAYLGLDEQQAVADYRTHHDSSPFRPIPSLGGAPEPREISPWVGIAVAGLLALAIGLGSLWYFAGDRIGGLGRNLRGLVVHPTATATPSPTAPPTITATMTRSPTITPTLEPTQTPTSPPPSTPTGAPPPSPAATAGP